MGFAECNQAVGASYGSDWAGCTSYGSGLLIAGGVATGTVSAVYGQLPNNPDPLNSCTEQNNGSCVVRAFALPSTGPVTLASSPITFEAPAGATVTATPSTGLDDGDQVAVSVSNIPPTAGTTIDVNECNTEVGACKRLAEGTSSGGAYSTTVSIVDGALDGSATCDETTNGHCVIQAFDHANQTVLATTPITFATQSLQLDVQPATGLKDQQQVQVTASGLPSGESSLYVLECNTAYAATHGYANLDACQRGYAVPVTDHSLSTTVTVVEGTLNDEDSSPSCAHANNGDCAIVLVAAHFEDASPYSLVGSPAPISFRAPITDPATISATPTSGLHGGSPVSLTVTNSIPDGVDRAAVLECNTADVKTRGYAAACTMLSSVSVVDNAIPPQKLVVAEGPVGGAERPSLCDNLHPCELGLYNDLDFGAPPVLVSNLVDIAFRDPDIGTPVVAVSPHTGLTGGQSVKVSLSKISDLVRIVYLRECNLSIPKKQWQGDSPPCVAIKGKAVVIKGNRASTTAKVHAGLVGYRDSGHGGKKVFCNAATNGQCAIVAYQPEGSYGARVGIIARSTRIAFAAG